MTQTLAPTGHCFDDALEYIERRVKEDRRVAHSTTLRLAHGIAVGSTGTRYAHAWCEEGGECWDAGLLNGERIYYAVARDEFYAARQIEAVTLYTIREACLHNVRSLHYGPWDARYRLLCGRGDQVMGTIQADASGATIHSWDDQEPL